MFPCRDGHTTATLQTLESCTVETRWRVVPEKCVDREELCSAAFAGQEFTALFQIHDKHTHGEIGPTDFYLRLWFAIRWSRQNFNYRALWNGDNDLPVAYQGERYSRRPETVSAAAKHKL